MGALANNSDYLYNFGIVINNGTLNGTGTYTEDSLDPRADKQTKKADHLPAWHQQWSC